MKKVFFLIMSITFSVSWAKAQGNFPVWDEDYAFGGNSDDYLIDVYQDEVDYWMFFAGHTRTSNNQDVNVSLSGDEDIWVVKTDPEGVVIYKSIFGGDSSDFLASIVPTSDNGFLLAGYSASNSSGEKSTNSKGGFDYWIVKISENGNKEWDRTIGGSGDDVLTCAISDGGGGFYLGGYSLSTLSGDKTEATYGDEDYWIVKVGSNGNVIWDLTLGGDTTDILKNMQLGADQNLLVGGHSISEANGTKSEVGYGGFDFWLSVVTPQGVVLKDTTLGGNRDDFLEEIRPRIHSAGFWVAGTSFSGSTGSKRSGSYGNGDFWVLNLDSLLTPNFDRTIGSSKPEMLKDLELSPEGSAIIAGWGSTGGGNKGSGTNGGIDNWIIKMDTLGSVYWDRNYGGADNDTLEAIFIKCDRGILAGGYSESGVSGDRSHANKGVNDYWAYELSIPTKPNFRAENVCEGVPLNFFDLSDVWPDSWSWDFDDPLSADNSSEDANPIHTFSRAGVYNVEMIIKEGCQNDTAITKEITVYENTVFDKVDLGDDRSICGGPITLQNEDPNEPIRVNYRWSTGDSTNTIIADQVGFYWVTVSDLNCFDSDTVEIDTCPLFFIPNAFTPDGDGLNEVFKVEGVGLNEFQLYIFNRWGQLIFQSKDQEVGWDGSYMGNPVQTDVYVYKLVYKGLGFAREQVVGRISLLR